MAETPTENPLTASASASVRIIAIAVLFGCIYYASSVVITLICSILIASVLDPGVRVMEMYRVPRWLASLLMVLLMLTVAYLLIYAVYDRTQAFFDEMPKLVARLKQITAHIQLTAHNIQQSTQTIIPASPEANMPMVRLQQESPYAQFLLRGIGSVYAFAVTVMFIPFLVFFMLTSKNQMWAASLNLFPIQRRQQAEDVIHAIARMLRQFVVGNLFVGLISACIITPVFAIIHLQYALLMGPLAALLSLVPYIGVALGILPPLLVALMQYDTTGPFIVIGVAVALVHFLAVNILTPKLVGQRVNLNALAVTISMMFWSWLWGGFGLVLAVPITAAIKAVCDNVESLKPYGAWMGEG
ncbi:MAG: AI-2E family transporter [Acidobacteriota bacterium]|nr:AI-2E family transporter [Acidobacteriota bacterium]